MKSLEGLDEELASVYIKDETSLSIGDFCERSIYPQHGNIYCGFLFQEFNS